MRIPLPIQVTQRMMSTKVSFGKWIS